MSSISLFGSKDQKRAKVYRELYRSLREVSPYKKAAAHKAIRPFRFRGHRPEPG
jgi:hypothetical protein